MQEEGSLLSQATPLIVTDAVLGNLWYTSPDNLLYSTKIAVK